MISGALALLRRSPAEWRFRPNSIRASGHGLVLTEPFRRDVSNDKVLGRNRCSRQTPKHRQLPGVRHYVGEWALKQFFRLNASQEIGLKLERTQGPVETLVIDSAVKISGN